MYHIICVFVNQVPGSFVSCGEVLYCRSLCTVSFAGLEICAVRYPLEQCYQEV
jgi:hypothetical protein